MSQRVREREIQPGDIVGVADHTQVVDRINDKVDITITGDRFSYDTSQNAGQVGGNSTRDITIPIDKSNTNILTVRVVPLADTQAAFEIYEDPSRDAIDRAFQATQIEDTDILNTTLSGITGLPYIEKNGNAELHARIVNNTATPSNFRIEVKAQ